MAFKDGDFISKEKHELDYVLRKWEKRTTQANRDILIASLDRFYADKGQEPHTRELFYAFAAKSGLLGRLEGKGEAEALAEAAAVASSPLDAKAPPAGASEPPGQAPAKKAFPWWILLLVLILLIVLFFLLRGCAPAQGKPEAPAPSGAAMMSAAPAAVAPGAMMAAPATVENPELSSLAGLPAPTIAIRFQPDSPDRLLAGEEEKLGTFIDALAAFTAGRILITGHAAGIGYPAGEERISLGRAEYVAERLRALGLPKGFVLRTLGKGASLPVADPDPETSRRLSRRVEFSFE